MFTLGPMLMQNQNNQDSQTFPKAIYEEGYFQQFQLLIYAPKSAHPITFTCRLGEIPLPWRSILLKHAFMHRDLDFDDL